MTTALDHVQLAAPPGSETTLRHYYRNILGMTEIPKPPVLAARGGTWFQAGNAQLHVGTEEPFTPARKAHPALLITDIHAHADTITHRGAIITWDHNLPGYTRFYSHDPHGNRIEFLEPLQPPVTSDH